MHKDAISARTERLYIMLAPKFPTQPAIRLKIHNLHEAINQSPHFFYPLEEDSVQWGFYLPGRQMDLDRKP